MLYKHAHKQDIDLYQQMELNSLKKKNYMPVSSIPPEYLSERDNLMQRYAGVFRIELPPGLPPKRTIDQEIDIKYESKPPHRALFQLSPAELLVTKNYVTSLPNKGKIRPTRSRYGAPLFFVKQMDSIRGVIDYRTLNRITKRNNAPIPWIDEMFDRLGRAKLFSKLHLKAGIHQIRVKTITLRRLRSRPSMGIMSFS